MKKFLCIMLIFALLCPIFSVQAEDAISVVVNGKKLEFDVPPMLIQDRTMVPLRAIFEALGAKVDYNDTTKKITATLGPREITLRVNTPAMYVNGSEYLLDVPATVVDGRTLVPVRAVAEAFNCEVIWNEKTSTVTIKREKSIYDVIAPKVDFTEDDGTKSKLHYDTRKTFSQKLFPSLLYSNKEVFKSLFLKGTTADAVKLVDDQIWIPAMDDTAAIYLLANDPEFEQLGNADAIQRIDELANRYELWPHQSYVVDILKLEGSVYCLMIDLADIGETAVLDEKERLHIAPFIAVVYAMNKKAYHYFCLEKIDKTTYELCSYDKNLKRTAIYGCQKDKQAFLDAIKTYISK